VLALLAVAVLVVIAALAENQIQGGEGAFRATLRVLWMGNLALTYQAGTQTQAAAAAATPTPPPSATPPSSLPSTPIVEPTETQAVRTAAPVISTILPTTTVTPTATAYV
jgi:hypothetical protein